MSFKTHSNAALHKCTIGFHSKHYFISIFSISLIKIVFFRSRILSIRNKPIALLLAVIHQMCRIIANFWSIQNYTVMQTFLGDNFYSPLQQYGKVYNFAIEYCFQLFHTPSNNIANNILNNKVKVTNCSCSSIV